MSYLIRKTKKSDFELLTAQEVKSYDFSKLNFFQKVSGLTHRYMVRIKSTNNRDNYKFVDAYSFEHASQLFPNKFVKSVNIMI